MIALLFTLVALAEPPAVAPEAAASADLDAEAAPVADLPDRSAPPPVVPPVALSLPVPEEHVLASGASVLLVTLPGVRKVDVSVLHGRGGLDLHGWPTPLATATGWLQDGATATSDPEALAERAILDEIEIGTWIGLQTSAVELTVPRESLAAGLTLLGEVVREPAFPGRELRRYRRETTRWFEVEAVTSPRNVASSALAHGWYPADHVFGARPDLAGLRKLKRGALLSTHARLITESPTTVLVVGDVTWADVEPLLNAALAGVGQPGERQPDPPFTPPAASRVIAVDLPGETQATIRLRTAAPLRDDADRVPMTALDFAVGGSFLSRLNRNLREEKGFTYGVGSSYGAEATRGHWTVFVDVPAANVGETLSEIDREMALVRDEGITAAELAAARNIHVSGWNETLQTASSAAGRYWGLLMHDETVESARARLLSMDELTVEDVQRVAQTWWGADDPRLTVVVGDRATIDPQLRALGLEPEWIAPEQAVLGVW